MTVELPPSLTADEPRTIEAIYFVIRTLRNTLRGYESAALSSEPSPEAHALATRAIAEIEATNGEPIGNFGANRAVDYIASLEDLQRSAYLAAVGKSADDAVSELREMRSTSL